MTEAEQRDLQDAALAADRLRTDPAFQRAIPAMRNDAVAALIALDSTDIEANRTRRAEIAAIDLLCTHLAEAIRRGNQATRRPAAVA